MTEQEVKEWMEKVRGKKISFVGGQRGMYVIPTGRYIKSEFDWLFEAERANGILSSYSIGKTHDWIIEKEEEKEQWYEHTITICNTDSGTFQSHSKVTTKKVNEPEWVK